MSYRSQTFSVLFLQFLLKRRYFKELNEICEQICKAEENQYNDEK